MVRMDGDVQAKKLNKGFFVSKAQEIGEIPGVIFAGVDGRKLAGAKDIAVDASSDIGEFSNPKKSKKATKETRNDRTDPYNPQRQVPNTPFWKYPHCKPWQRPSHGSGL